MTPALVTELKRLMGQLEGPQPAFRPLLGDTGQYMIVSQRGHAHSEHNGWLTLNTGLFIEAAHDAAPALLEAVEAMHAALERCGQLDCDSPIECQDKIIWRCHSCKAKDALARVAGLLGAKEERNA